MPGLRVQHQREAIRDLNHTEGSDLEEHFCPGKWTHCKDIMASSRLGARSRDIANVMQRLQGKRLTQADPRLAVHKWRFLFFTIVQSQDNISEVY